MFRTLAVLAVLALMLIAVSAGHSVVFNPDTTVIVYIHGFDMSGWNQSGVYGDTCGMTTSPCLPTSWASPPG